MHTPRTLIRLAQRLHDAWQARSRLREDGDHQWQYLLEAWTKFLTARRQLQRAESRGFRHCLASLREDYHWQLDELNNRLQPLRDRADPPDREPSLADWVWDLKALEKEFGELTIDDARGVLGVITERIVLEGIDLGPFEVILSFSRLADRQGTLCFEILAKAPNPASGRDDVTHPHVNEGELCAGDAAVPIERALTEGRILDAFLLIRSVLTNYNSRSPYVRLDEWDGFTCSDCAARIPRDESTYCRGCEADLCESCRGSCRGCEETRCGNCLTPCEACSACCCSGCLDSTESGLSVCGDCLASCGECSTALTHFDLNDDGLCAKCVAADAETPEPQEELSNVQ